MIEHLIVAGAVFTERHGDPPVVRWQCSCRATGTAPDQTTAERQAEQHVPAGARVRWKAAK